MFSLPFSSVFPQKDRGNFPPPLFSLPSGWRKTEALSLFVIEVSFFFLSPLDAQEIIKSDFSSFPPCAALSGIVVAVSPFFFLHSVPTCLERETGRKDRVPSSPSPFLVSGRCGGEGKEKRKPPPPPPPPFIVTKDLNQMLQPSPSAHSPADNRKVSQKFFSPPFPHGVIT